MTHILDRIVAHKREEVAQKKALFPIKRLEKSIHFEAPTVSLEAYLKRSDKTGIIAEFKRRSPSRTDLNAHADVESVSIGYMQAGASALSILTDSHFFGGSNADLTTARLFNFCPILRKDFIIDTYQILEARSIGADAILLIADILSAEQVEQFASLAETLSLEVLLEIHDIDQLSKLVPGIRMIGVNNRNLRTFHTDIQYAVNVFDALPRNLSKVAESGIRTAEDLIMLRDKGYDGFLIGTQFMVSADPVQACKRFVQDLERKMIQPSITT